MRYSPTGQPMEVRSSWWRTWSKWSTWRKLQPSLETWTSAWTKIQTVSSLLPSMTLASSSWWLALLTRLAEGLTTSTSEILMLCLPVSIWRPMCLTSVTTTLFVSAWRQRSKKTSSWWWIWFAFFPGLLLKLRLLNCSNSERSHIQHISIAPLWKMMIIGITMDCESSGETKYMLFWTLCPCENPELLIDLILTL